MQTVIGRSQDFDLEAALSPIGLAPGLYSFELRTTWRGAKNPAASHTLVQVTLDRDGLRRFQELLALATEAA